MRTRRQEGQSRVLSPALGQNKGDVKTRVESPQGETPSSRPAPGRQEGNPQLSWEKNPMGTKKGWEKNG